MQTRCRETARCTGIVYEPTGTLYNDACWLLAVTVPANPADTTVFAPGGGLVDSYTLEPTGKGFDYKHGIPIGRKDFAQVYAGDVDGVAPDDVVAVYEDGSVEVFLTKYDPANPLLAATGGVGFHPMGVVIGAGVATVSTVNFIGTLDGYGTICRGGDFGCVSAQRAVFVGTTDTDDYVFVSPLNAQTAAGASGRRLSTEREMDFSVVFTPLANTRHRTLSSVRFWADYDMTHQALAIGTGRESPNTLGASPSPASRSAPSRWRRRTTRRASAPPRRASPRASTSSASPTSLGPTGATASSSTRTSTSSTRSSPCSGSRRPRRRPSRPRRRSPRPRPPPPPPPPPPPSPAAAAAQAAAAAAHALPARQGLRVGQPRQLRIGG